MIQDTDIYFGLSQGVKVELKKDGKVELNWPGVAGMSWFFKPGPAHLDTCEFFIRSKTDADLVLNYVGFIDRGQRIESRFVSFLASYCRTLGLCFLCLTPPPSPRNPRQIQQAQH
jgi:hypothetical protein